MSDEPIRSRFLDHDGPLAFAHRGGASDAPENTLAAFGDAVEIGFRYLETDAHCTADGVVVAFHDDRLDRVTDRTGTIAELPWSEVAAARVDGREPIPLLEDLLMTWPDVCLNIDAKHDEVVDPLIDLVKKTGTGDRVCLASFSDERIGRMRAALPGVVTSLGARATARLRAAATGLPAGRFEGECAQVPPKVKGLPMVTGRFVETAHARGLEVHVWTIDDPDEMRRLLDLGVDGIMTDRPRVLKQVLIDRGEWR